MPNGVPTLSNAESWLVSIKADFLAIPARVRQDQSQLDAVNSMGTANQNDIPGVGGALAGLPQIGSALADVMDRWNQAVGPLAQAEDALQQGGSGTITAAVMAAGQAGAIIALVSELATAEHGLDLIAQQVLTGDQYAAWHQNKPVGFGAALGASANWEKIALWAVGGYVGYRVIRALLRGERAA